jgi:hypothetical protein
MKPLEAAQRTALAGDTDAARAAFEQCLTHGQPRAAAALAEISAFEGRWRDVVRYVGCVFDDPRACQTQNVFHEMTGLGGRAAAARGCP